LPSPRELKVIVMQKYQGVLLVTVFVFGVSMATLVVAEEGPMDKADAAVANILFDYDYSEEYASYAVKEDGFVDVTFAKNTPDELYSEILNKLNNHPDINGVLAGKTGAYCSRF
jgi:ABC-type sugar transport system substrate-binding protein